MGDSSDQADPSLTWRLVHSEPGKLVFAAPGAVPALPPVAPVARRRGQRIRRRSQWKPSGSPDVSAAGRAGGHATLTHARRLGRAGVLAAALGVGAALVSRQPPVAAAEPGATDSVSSSSTSEPVGTASTSTREASEVSATERTARETEDRETEDRETEDRETDEATETAEPSETPNADSVPDPVEDSEAPQDEPKPTEIGSSTSKDDDSPTATAEVRRPAAQTEPGPVGEAEIPPEPEVPEAEIPEPEAPEPTEPEEPAPAAAPDVASVATSVPAEDIADRPDVPAVAVVSTPFVADPPAPSVPVATTATAQAAQTPVLWGLFDWVRKTFAGSTPELGYDPASISQVGNTVTGVLTGTGADSLTYAVISSTNGGTVVVHPDGTFTYIVPLSMYRTGGTDTFTIGDAGAASTVTVSVAPVNSAPVAGVPAYTVGAVDHTTGAVTGHLEVTDPDSDTLHYTLTGGAVEGAVQLDLTTGTFTYTPTAAGRQSTADHPSDTFTVTVDDGHGNAIDVPVTVDIDPSAATSVNAVVAVADSGSGPTSYLVVHDDSTVDAADAAGPAAAPATVDLTALPRTGEVGPAPSIGAFLQWLWGQITRTLFNQSPTIGYNPAQNTLVDGVVTGNLNIFDADGDPLTVTVAAPPRGSLVVNPDGTFTYTPDGAMATAGGLDIFNVMVSETNRFSHLHGLGDLIHILSFGILGNRTDIAATPVLVTAGPVAVTLPPDGYGFAEGFDLINLSPEELDRELDAVVRAHGQWLRVPIPWAMIETSPGQYDWTIPDRLINAAAARNLKVLANIFYAPAWSRDSQMYSPPADLTTMATFTTKLVQRYGDTVSNWQIWNEPNLPPFFGMQDDRARKYAAMLKATYTAIKAVQPDSTVVAAGMAIDVGTESPVGFLQQMYAAGAAGYFDAYAMHPYTGPGGIASDPYNAWSDVARVHDLMTAHGDGTKKIWLTEIGGATDCQLCSAFAPILGPLSVTTSQQDQTAHILEIFSAAAQTDYIGPVFIFSIRDQGLLPEINGHAHMGSLLTNDWQPKYTGWVLANAS